MKYKAKIEISSKPFLFDPEGEAAKKSLQGLSFDVANVRASKVFEIILDASSLQEAETAAESMCRKLLANPNKDDYKITVAESGGQ